MLSEFSSAQRNIEILSQLTGINIDIIQKHNISCASSVCNAEHSQKPYCTESGYVFLCECGMLYFCINADNFTAVLEPVLLDNLLSPVKHDSVVRRINMYRLLKSSSIEENDFSNEIIVLFTKGEKEAFNAALCDYLTSLVGKFYDNFYVIKSHLLELLLKLLCYDNFLNNKIKESTVLIVKKINSANSISKIYDALEHYENALFKKSIKSTKQTKEDVVAFLIEYINKNYENNISLDDLSKKVFVSKSYLSRIFKEVTKINFLDYLNEIRVEKSKYFLKHTNMTVSAVASKVGYTCSGYYTKIFKRITKMTPSEYRASERI